MDDGMIEQPDAEEQRLREAVASGVENANRLAETGQWEAAYQAQVDCDALRAELYRREMDRTIRITEERTKLEHDREAAMQRDRERDRILHAVLPPQIADLVKQGHRHIAEHIPSATIMFVDIAGFTGMTSERSPADLVRWLEDHFASLDAVFQDHGCERIKTIGDAYMAMCTAQATSETEHVHRITRAALDVLHDTARTHVDRSQLRFGLHTGPVIAGVMRGSKLSYDVWGDTVNVAARMRSLSLPGHIHCTADVARILSSDASIHLVQRSPLDVRGKGIMTTYFVEKA